MNFTGRRQRITALILALLLAAAACIPEPGIRAEETTAAGMVTDDAGVSLIKSFEGCVLTAYKAVSTETYYTIGYGHYGADVTEGMTITQEEAEALLRADLLKFETSVNKFLTNNALTVTQKQFDALVSFTYNCGPKWTTSSTLRTYLLNGIGNYTHQQIADAFGLWNTSGGKVLKGLTLRRYQEAMLFLGGPEGVYSVCTEYINIRSGAGVSNALLGTVVNGQRVSIRAIKRTSGEIWGQMTSGWICLHNGTGAYAMFEESEAAISSVVNSAAGVVITWAADPGAVYYNLMRSREGEDAIVLASTTELSYTDATAEAGVVYTYYVNSVLADGSINVQSATASEVTNKYFPAPQLTFIGNAADGVKLKWTAVAGAESYQLLRRTDDGAFSAVVSTTELTYTDTTAVSGTAYTYTVQVLADQGLTAGAYDETGLRIVRLAVPQLLSVVNKTSGCYLTWTAAGDNVKYEVYRRKTGGSYQSLGRTKKTAYTDKTASNGKTYQYKVRAFYEDTGGAVFTGKFSNEKKLCRLKTPTVKALTNLSYRRLRLTYSRNSAAKGYIITYSTSSKMTKAGKVKVTSPNTKTVTLTGLKKKTYYVRIQSYCKVDGKVYKSAWSAKSKLKVKK